MKKLVLSALLSVLFMGVAVAQFNISTNAVIGQILKNANPLDKDTFIVNFNTNSFPTSTKWAPAKATANLGKDSLYVRKVQTQKGLQVKGFADGTTNEYRIGTADCNNYGSNRNPLFVHSIDSLKKILAKSIVSGTFATINGNTSDSLSRPAACIFEVGASDGAFGMYPGKVKRMEYGFYISMSGKKVLDDITFEMNTLDAGNSGKTATYSMRVYKSSTFTPANAIGDTVVNLYTTGSGKVTINVAQKINVSPSEFTNKTIYIIIKTLGTSNALGVYDALPNPVNASNEPTITDPAITFDNLTYTFYSPYFTYPISTSTNSNYVNYNDGAPAIKATDSGLTNPGTAKTITTGVSTPVSILLQSAGRSGTFTIIENISHSTHVTYNTANAFMKNDGSGNYNVPVTCTESINGTTSLWTLTIAAPTAGTFVDDDMKFNFNVNRPTDGTTNLRLEISNGSARMWYDFSFVASTTTDVDGKAISPIGISTSNSSIAVINATQNIDIYTLSGQKVAFLTANNAQNGIAVKAGAFIVKHGSQIHKVMVK